MAGKEDPTKNSHTLGRGSTPVEEEVAARTFCGKRTLEEGTKTKAEDSQRAVAAGGGKPAAVDVADEKPDAAAGSNGDGVKWVQMPLEDISWLLAQKREDYRVLTLEDYTLHRSSGELAIGLLVRLCNSVLSCCSMALSELQYVRVLSFGNILTYSEHAELLMWYSGEDLPGNIRCIGIDGERRNPNSTYFVVNSANEMT
ncbi:hypothetical protein U9M48_041040 [Paspalum notatum var. saurae]|uniref:Uncharacterized protein n=1 Tax=Paspalum notatum var. saurae TaxID=547442 RepID=A0AAQ3UMX6_PASNO